MMEIKYTYQRTKEDFMQHSVWHRLFRTKYAMFLNFFMPVLAITMVIFSFDSIDQFTGILIAYLILFPVVNYLMVRIGVNRMFKNQNLEFDVTTFTYNQEGIGISSDKGDLTLEYTRVYKVYVTKKFVYIYLDRTNAFLVNKEFVGEQNIEAILALFKEYLVPGTLVYKRF